MLNTNWAKNIGWSFNLKIQEYFPAHSAEKEVGYLAAFVVNSTSQSVELHYIHYKVATILPEEMSNFWDPN